MQGVSTGDPQDRAEPSTRSTSQTSAQLPAQANAARHLTLSLPLTTALLPSGPDLNAASQRPCPHCRSWWGWAGGGRWTGRAPRLRSQKSVPSLLSLVQLLQTEDGQKLLNHAPRGGPGHKALLCPHDVPLVSHRNQHSNPPAPTLPRAMEQAARPMSPPFRLWGCWESANSCDRIWITCLIWDVLF